MFLVCFLVFTLVFTVFQNATLAGISLALALVSLMIYQSVSRKKILSRKTLFLLLGAFLLAGFAFAIKERRYSIPAATLDAGMRNEKGGYGKTFIGSGTISDISGQGKYVFSDGNNDFLLRSEKRYTIGDHLRLVGNLQTNPNPSWHSYWIISSGTFAVPIFSGGFDYGKWLKMKGRQGTIYETNSLLIRSQVPGSKSQMGIIQSVKKSIQQKIIAVYGENKVSGLILGMLIGDKSQIPEVDYQQFIDSGLVHLIAVSGGNILMIVVFLQFVFFFLPFYVRIGLILLTVTGYSLICGLDSSVFRAMLMGGLSMVALFWGREINIRRLLSISALVMLIINPYFLAYDTGFLLSYSAIIGIVYFDTITRSQDPGSRSPKNRIKNVIQYIYKNYISPSIGASIGIFPIIIFFMGQINLVSIIGNLLVLPIVPFVMIYGFVSVWLYTLFGWGFLVRIEQFLVNYIYNISELLSTHGVFFVVSGLWVKYLILLIFVGIFIFRKLQKKESESSKS